MKLRTNIISAAFSKQRFIMKKYNIPIILILLFIVLNVFAGDMGKKNADSLSLFRKTFSEKNINLFFFSDLHGDENELKRYCEFTEENRKYLDDTICAGDLIQISCKSDWTFYDRISGSEKILLAIGNHDLYLDAKRGNPSKERLTQKDAYEKYIKPRASNWNAYTREGYIYYYKDYPQKHIRIIFLASDLPIGKYNVQLDWFRGVLKSAYNKKYSVISVHHRQNSIDAVTITCDYNSETMKKKYKASAKFEPYLKAVRNFQDYGGDFICWLGGHIHHNYLCYDRKYRQLCVTVGVTDTINRDWVWAVLEGKEEKPAKYRKNRSGKNCDCADLISVNTEKKEISIIPLGLKGSDRSYKISYTDFSLYEEK